MAKKYLLYIHNPKFELEEKKSDLVNALLDDLYSNEDMVLPPVKISTKNVQPTIIERQKERSMDFCKNGHPIPEGRDKCLGRGCKYS